jgi:hypothetical protein
LAGFVLEVGYFFCLPFFYGFVLCASHIDNIPHIFVQRNRESENVTFLNILIFVALGLMPCADIK